MTKARVDSLCSEVKRYFPTLPAGVEHQHQLFEPTKSYRACDFIVDQYNSYMGSVTAWRDAGLAMAARDHHAILFSMNVLNGGTQDKDGTWDCAGTGGKGPVLPELPDDRGAGQDVRARSWPECLWPLHVAV